MRPTPTGRRKKDPPPLEYGDGSVFQRKSDGRWLVKVRKDGKYVQIGSNMDEQKARAILDQYHADLAAGLDPSGRDWGTGAWLDYSLEAKLPVYGKNGKKLKGVEILTWEKYETQIRNHVKPYIGPILAPRLVDVDAPQCQRWFNKLCKTGLGADVLIEALQRLSAAMELAVDYDLIPKNPCRRIERPERPERKHVKPSELDLIRLMRTIDADPQQALVWIAMGGGGRRGEAAGLMWEDISIYSAEHGIIRFHRRHNRITRRTQERFEMPSLLEREGLKRQAERLTDIGSLTIAMLQQHWQHQLAARARAGDRWKGEDYDPAHPSGYVFTTPIGTPIDVDDISEYLNEVRERAGLDIQRFHALRRVFATLLRATGAPDKVIMELGGWADVEMVHYYEDPMASHKREAAMAYDAYLRTLYVQAMAPQEAAL